MSPVVVGSIFAWSISEGLKLGFPLNVHFAFTLLSIGSVLAIATSCVLPEGLNRRQPEDTRVLAAIKSLHWAVFRVNKKKESH